MQDIREAAVRIAPIAKRTPVLTSTLVNERAGVQAYFKCENFQKGGSFKIRGAANFAFSIPKEDVPKGIVAFSSGNHAGAVALAGRHVGAKVTLVMPSDAPASKVAACKDYGATVVLYDRFTEDREAIGRRIAAETGATLIPPFDHERIISGAGTAALELIEGVPDLDALVVCVGGGGLLSGSSIAAHGLKPGLRIFGVEPETGNDFYLSVKAGERVEIPPPPTIADGLRTPKPGALTFPIVREHAEAILLVSDDEIRETTAFLASRMKMIVEPSGGVSAAAVLFRKIPAGLGKVGVIISGGNV